MSWSGRGGNRLSLTESDPDSGQPGDEYEDHGHTLCAMQGRGVRRELSNMTLNAVGGFQGDDALAAGGESPGSTPLTSPNETPSTTLTGTEQASLSGAIAPDPVARAAAQVAAQGRSNVRRRESMPPSSGHARLDGLFPAETNAIEPIAENDEESTIMRTQLAASDDEAEESPADASDVRPEVPSSDKPRVFRSNQKSAARPNPLQSMLEKGDPKRPSSDRRGSLDMRRDVPSSKKGGILSETSSRALRAKSTAPRPNAPRVSVSSADTQVDRRQALRSVARDVESLMLISEALSAKEMPVLAKRLKEGLGRIQDNARLGYKTEGLTARKQSALRRVNRVELLREAAADVQKTARMPRMSFGRMSLGPNSILSSLPPRIAEEDMSNSAHAGKHHRAPAKERTFKEHCVRAGIVGVVLLILCCIPHILHQYEPDAAIAATQGAYVVDGNEPVVLALSHKSEGLYEILVGAGKCDAYSPGDDGNEFTSHSYYSATVSLMQEDAVLESDTLKLHDKGVQEASSKRRRNLLSGGGAAGPTGADVYETFYFDASPRGSGPNLRVEVKSDCPAPLGVSIEAVTVGPIGSSQHWIALALLIIVFALIITEVVHRTLIAFMGAAAVLFLLALEHRLPSVYVIMQWMDHGTLALLWGMMIIVALLARSGVFEFCSVRLIEASGMDMWRLTWMLMLFDCVLSAFLDNVSTMLLLGPVIISLCKAIDMDPRPMLIPMALFGNIGGTSTMIGDPPNLIIGNAFKEELGFVDFLKVLAPGVCLTLPPALAFLRWYYGKEVYGKKIDVDMSELRARYPIRDHALLARCGVILGFVLMLFFLHPVVHFEPAYAALFGAIAILLMGPAEDFEHALEKVEWDSLLFFAGLFVFTEGVAELGLLRIIADQLSSVIESVPVGSRTMVSSVLIQVVAAVASAFVDNIPFTTTMIPVIRRMAANVEGLELRPLAWALCFGADYGGMGTLIGASANVVMAGVAAEAGYPVSFMSFFKIGWPMMCLGISISVPYLCLCIHAGYT